MSPYTAAFAATLTNTLDHHPEDVSVVVWAVKAHLMGRGLTVEQTAEYVSDMIRQTWV